MILLERMDGGRFHTVHSCTTKAVCAASNRRPTTAKGAAGQDLDVSHAIGLALAAGPERWTAMEGGVPVLVDGQCIGGVGVSGGDWETDLRIAKPAVESIGAQLGMTSSRSARGEGKAMSADPLRVACIGMGWWSDVLADAMQRSGKLEIVSCYTRSEDKRENFAAKYGCRPAASYEAMLADREIEAIINTTPNDVHLATTSAAAAAGKHVFLDKPIANTSPTAAPSPRPAARPAWCWRSATSGGAKAISAGSSSRSTPACSASSSTPRPTSAATASARSI